jgi:hypothetical protein
MPAIRGQSILTTASHVARLLATETNGCWVLVIVLYGFTQVLPFFHEWGSSTTAATSPLTVAVYLSLK